MNAELERLEKCLDYIRSKTSFVPQVAMVLGSGLGGYADGVKIQCVVNYKEIDGFPVSTISGHRGRFVFGWVGSVPVVIMQGRVHYYEGYSMDDVVMPIRLMKMLGAKTLLITNASGGINTGFSAGDFMLITDHIMNFVPSPLIGKNIDEFGERFPDMSEVYSVPLRNIIADAADRLGIKLQQGVYIQLTGPNYETPAEIRMCRALGADAVGMSTACEAVAARHCGMKVCGIACISNMAAGMTGRPLNHNDVKSAADTAAEQFSKLITESVIKIGDTL